MAINCVNVMVMAMLCYGAKEKVVIVIKINCFNFFVFSLTQKILRKLPPNGSNEKSVFPELPGSHLALKNPALEFVKSVCQVCVSMEEYLYKTNHLQARQGCMW